MPVTATYITLDDESRKILAKIPSGYRSKVIRELLKRFANQNTGITNKSALKEAIDDTDADFDLESFRQKVQSKRKKKTRSVL